MSADDTLAHITLAAMTGIILAVVIEISMRLHGTCREHRMWRQIRRDMRRAAARAREIGG